MVAAWSAAALLLGLPLATLAFDLERYDNVVAYWGQNSYGGANPGDVANHQKSLDFYCNLGSMDMFPISFVVAVNGTGGLPQIDLANICNNPRGDPYFAGSQLLNCQFLASQITACQAKGKALTISLGGATAAVSFSSNAQATAFADTIWNLFLGGTSSTRPFGSAVLDGVDIDIESGGNVYFVAFLTRMKQLFNGASKKYYITGAPQCPFPDVNMDSMLNGAHFDAVMVQFYNNYCGVNVANSTNFNFGTWAWWAKNRSFNKNVKIFLGAPASSTAGGGYIAASSLNSLATSLRKSFPAFGGVMYWDASQAYNNARFDTSVKNSLVAAGGTGFTYPACTAPAYATGGNYPAGSQVTYNGYIWKARWFASGIPDANINDNGEWVAISACGGPPPVTTTSTSTTTTSRTTTTTTTTTSRTTTSTTTTTTTPPTGGSCSGVAAWVSSVAYTGGQHVTYGGHLWTAKWWTQADTPGGAAGVWTDNGACTAKLQSRFFQTMN